MKTVPTKNERVERLWPLDSAAEHFQATVFSAGKSTVRAIEAAKALRNRRFQVQVLRVSARAQINDILAEIVLSSSRIVVLEEEQATRRLGASVAQALTRSDRPIPLVRLTVANPSCELVMEACLRNIE